MSRLPNEESFLNDVASHEMTVFRDDGLYRHLRFQKPGTWYMGFDVVTWPRYLAYTGDMGCYIFSRLPDMFEFFRSHTDGLYVNPHYWGEKVDAVDRNGPIKEYDPESFRKAVLRWLDDAEASIKVRRRAKAEVLSRADDGHHEAVGAAMEFECDGFRFDSFYEVDVTEYSFRFLWFCYAVTWAIRKYDASKVR